MANLRPKHAATAAVASYRIRSSTNVSNAFATIPGQVSSYYAAPCVEKFRLANHVAQTYSEAL